MRESNRDLFFSRVLTVGGGEKTKGKKGKKKKPKTKIKIVPSSVTGETSRKDLQKKVGIALQRYTVTSPSCQRAGKSNSS